MGNCHFRRLLAKKTKFDDLCDDLVYEILKWFTPNHLFFVERVCKTWQRNVRKLMDQVKVININYYDYKLMCHHHDIRRFVNLNQIFYKYNGEILLSIMSKCRNVESIAFKECDIFEDGILNKMIAMCPKLECISFWAIRRPESQWRSFIEVLGPHINHLSIFDATFLTVEELHLIFVSLQHLKTLNLQLFGYETDKLLAIGHVNSDTNVSLRIGARFFENNDINKIMISLVDQIDFYCGSIHLIGPKFKRLNKLTIQCHDSILTPIEMRHSHIDLPNLRALKMVELNKNNMELISTLRMPKLEMIHLKQAYKLEDCDMKPFFKQNKHVRFVKIDDHWLQHALSYDSLLMFECIKKITFSHKVPLRNKMINNFLKTMTHPKSRLLETIEIHCNFHYPLHRMLILHLKRIIQINPNIRVLIVMKYNYLLNRKDVDYLDEWRLALKNNKISGNTKMILKNDLSRMATEIGWQR